jgi:hypothetical protein
MSHIRKLVLVPADSMRHQKGYGEPPEDSGLANDEQASAPSGNDKTHKKRIERDIDKIRKLILIILKLAKHNSYNENFEIYNKNGSVIRDTDIVSLLNNALTFQRNLIGLDRFVEILHEANVDPNWIVNDNIKAKLLALNNKYSFRKNNERPDANNGKDQVEEKEIGDEMSEDMRLSEPRISNSPPPNVTELNKALKRKRQIDEDSESVIPIKKLKNPNWDEISDSDNE